MAQGTGTGADAPRPERPGPTLDVARHGTVVVLTVRGRLDADAGQALVEAATTACVGARRLDIDLRPVESYTTEGARALVACRALAACVAEGLHYRTGRGAGRQALLAAYSGRA
ncbi:MAG: STAS domain-containing protein [Acidimicrobiales bacterium]